MSIKTVFGTVELLEHILFALPPADVLPAIRINRQSKATFDGSEKLHQRVYLMPAQHETIVRTHFKDAVPSSQTSSSSVDNSHETREASSQHGHHQPLLPVWFNPVFFVNHRNEGSLYTAKDLLSVDRTSRPNLDDPIMKLIDLALGKREYCKDYGSLERMFLCQPPRTCVELVWYMDYKSQGCVREFYGQTFIKNKGGVTMGELLNALHLPKHTKVAHAVGTLIVRDIVVVSGLHIDIEEYEEVMASDAGMSVVKAECIDDEDWDDSDLLVGNGMEW